MLGGNLVFLENKRFSWPKRKKLTLVEDIVLPWKWTVPGEGLNWRRKRTHGLLDDRGLHPALSRWSRDTAGPPGQAMCPERPDLSLDYSVYTKIVQWF